MNYDTLTNHCLTALGQLDIGPMIPSLCEATGFIIIPATLLAWFWLMRRRRQKQTPGHAAVVFAVAVTNALCAAWVIGAIDEWLFEPKIDDTGAMVIVENLPEVRQYLDARQPNGPARDVKLDESQDAKLPRFTYGITVGETDGKNAPTLIWQRFRVNQVNSEVRALAAGSPDRWVTLEEWRNSRATSRPAP